MAVCTILKPFALCDIKGHYVNLNYTVYSEYSSHVYSGHSDIVATCSGIKYTIYSIIFRSNIVANRI